MDQPSETANRTELMRDGLAKRQAAIHEFCTSRNARLSHNRSPGAAKLFINPVGNALRRYDWQDWLPENPLYS